MFPSRCQKDFRAAPSISWSVSSAAWPATLSGRARGARRAEPYLRCCHSTTTLVPKVAVITDTGNNFAFVILGDSVERRAVKIGGSDGDRVEVLAGLRSGERVVVSPPPDMKDGSKVMVK